MSREIINTPLAPTAIGTYSQAVRVDNTVYISGQIPLVPETMKPVEGGMREQVTRVFDNITAVTKAAGGSLDDIVKLTVYLVDLEQFTLVNEIMSEYFEVPYPARAVVGVNRLPGNSMIEMDAVMVLHE